MTERSDEEEEGVIEAQLARRIARAGGGGDRDAESALFRRIEPRIRAWATHRLRGEAGAAGAADLAQHVMLVVLEALRADKIQEPHRIGAFIHGACKRTLMSWRRGERRRGAILEAFGPTLASVAATTTPDNDDVLLDQQRLAECFDHLAARTRSVLMLTFFADRSSDEIARELALSTANVRVLRHRALHELHDCVAGDGHAFHGHAQKGHTP